MITSTTRKPAFTAVGIGGFILATGATFAIGATSFLSQPLSQPRTASAAVPAVEVATPAPAKPVEPSLDYNRISYQGQLMTDYKVGKVLGEIKCGKRPVQEGMNLLNVNGVPAALLQNQTPELQRGFNAAAFGWGCV